jgi:hypothetical protein
MGVVDHQNLRLITFQKQEAFLGIFAYTCPDKQVRVVQEKD